MSRLHGDVRRSPVLSLALLLSLCAAGCSDGSDEGSPEDSDTMNDGSNAMMDGEGGAGSEMTAGQGGGGNAEGSGAQGGGSGAQGGGNDGAIAFSERGVCGARATGVITAEDFQIKEERYLLSDGGFGPDICVVSFDVTRVGDAPPGCDENAGQQTECLWTHLVRYDNPTVVLDENGVCANSELGMDADAIAAIDGFEVAYGYVFEYQGHNSVLMVYDEQLQRWEPGANAGWDEMTGDFLFDDRRGPCRYAAGTPAP